MSLRVVAAFTGVLGGGCWAARLFVEEDVLPWVGLVLLVISLAAAGASLVSSSATWLRLVVAVALPALAWSVLELFRESLDPVRVDAVAGAVVALLGVVTLVRRPTRSRHRGNH